ncbi:Protein BUD31-like 1 [Glycine soja]|uniref:Protein BUD31-like 1 n=1 Tax=Glycine soja TaxID=3848 RepID=A0A445KNR1_GLYSO|nr:Protein BUD31-like 1 [Glycine soja]
MSSSPQARWRRSADSSSGPPDAGRRCQGRSFVGCRLFVVLAASPVAVETRVFEWFGRRAGQRRENPVQIPCRSALPCCDSSPDVEPRRYDPLRRGWVPLRSAAIAAATPAINNYACSYMLGELLPLLALVSKGKRQSHLTSESIPGYERLCCLRCMQPRDHNFATTCVCRVPKQLREEKVIECVHCGCKGCASGD